MRINFALPGLGGLAGGMRVAAQHACYLHDRGHQVSLIVRRPDLRSWRGHWLSRLGLKPGFPPLSDLRGHFKDLDVPIVHLNEDRPLRAADVPDADVIVSTWWTTTEWTASLPSSKGRHVHLIQDYEDFVPSLSSRISAIYDQDTTKIVVAGWIRDRLRERHGKDSLVVSNGVDANQFRADGRKRGEPARIGFLYNGHPRKNVGLAIAALNRARQQAPDLRGLAFGVKQRPADLPAWIEYEQKPTQDRIAQLYASCDLWLFSSQSEGFGLPLLEAMASGTPVLATCAGAAPDLVDGQNGWLSDADPKAYADKILAFLDLSEDAWQAASQAARHTAERHDLVHSGRAFETALLSLVSRGNPKNAVSRPENQKVSNRSGLTFRFRA